MPLLISNDDILVLNQSKGLLRSQSETLGRVRPIFRPMSTATPALTATARALSTPAMAATVAMVVSTADVAADVGSVQCGVEETAEVRDDAAGLTELLEGAGPGAAEHWWEGTGFDDLVKKALAELKLCQWRRSLLTGEYVS